MKFAGILTAAMRAFAKKLRGLAFFGLLLFVPALRALPSGPETVLVVINQRSPLSRQIGEYYAEPAAQFRLRTSVGYKALARESITREEYDNLVAAPIGACLHSRGLTESILYIVLTQDLPLRVEGVVSLSGDNASVDSELTLLYTTLHGRMHPLPDLFRIRFFGRSMRVSSIRNFRFTW